MKNAISTFLRGATLALMLGASVSAAAADFPSETIRIIAGNAVAKARPDGHTLLLISNGTAVSEGLFKSLPFDSLKDFAPISIS